MVEFAADGVVVADGGLATELERGGHDLSGPLWSARLLADDPDAIRAVHAAYFAAGARIATTASYQASVEGFVRHGWSPAEAAELLRRSVRLAVAARADLPEPAGRWVAASVGPYGAALADGSEYRGRYGLSVDRLIDWHRPRLEILAEAGADLIACETVPDLVEAEALVRLVGETGVSAWLSYTIDGDRTRAGQPLIEAFALAEAPGIVAIGVNCCDPDDVPEAIAAARAVTDRPVVVYPNSGENWAGSWFGPSRFTASAARDWVAAGARIVGGCCRVGPDEITILARIMSDFV
ncbi:homocysteine S-methyltransferase [Microlunatus speluncae]|uniref:homocysteine S-methyltransferase n=1 Tax=Microlunatus speluncae TaxID=2594267 RepID=UPI001FE60D27|nr:homocysteine S-methyltransferase [Microlunatus speluncae]